MARNYSDEWSFKVGQVFDSRPRIAIDDLSRWIERREEKRFRNAVACPGIHVCLYGPSGSGKTSLAKTILGRLHKKGAKFIYVRLNHNSTWETFKSQIIENSNVGNPSDKGLGVKIGLQNLLPYLEISGEIGKGGGFLNSIPHSQIISSINISHISQLIIDLNLMLAIDDVNFASNELLLMLTSLAKEITDNSTASKAKIIFIGADDIFLRIIKLNDSLKDRTEEVSLGSVRDDEEGTSLVPSDRVWKFIADGLVQLGLQDPRNDELISKSQVQECILWIDHAADGLPKSIVRLGRIIAETGRSRNRVSYTDILDSAKAMTQRNFRHYRSRYRALVYAIKNSPTLQEVCLWLFKRGASRIHTLEEIAEDLHHLATYYQFEEAIETLAAKEFLTITGAEKNIFFARDPLLAHTIGVALREPIKCGVDDKYFNNSPEVTQLLLRFSGDKDPENRSKI